MISSTESILKITPCYQETIGEVQRKTWGRPGRSVNLQPSWVQPSNPPKNPSRYCHLKVAGHAWPATAVKTFLPWTTITRHKINSKSRYLVFFGGERSFVYLRFLGCSLAGGVIFKYISWIISSIHHPSSIIHHPSSRLSLPWSSNITTLQPCFNKLSLIPKRLIPKKLTS